MGGLFWETDATFGKKDFMARNWTQCDCHPEIRWLKIWLGVAQTEPNSVMPAI